ncbi:MAG: hypothetical protein ACOZNI_27100 [Myxococcota bacterium]
MEARGPTPHSEKVRAVPPGDHRPYDNTGGNWSREDAWLAGGVGGAVVLALAGSCRNSGVHLEAPAAGLLGLAFLAVLIRAFPKLSELSFKFGGAELTTKLDAVSDEVGQLKAQVEELDRIARQLRELASPRPQVVGTLETPPFEDARPTLATMREEAPATDAAPSSRASIAAPPPPRTGPEVMRMDADPWALDFGNQRSMNGYSIDATVIDAGAETATVRIDLRSERANSNWVAFAFLHPGSFGIAPMRVEPDPRGRASFQATIWGVFTVGVVIKDGDGNETRLGIPLSGLRGMPEKVNGR